MCSGRWVVRQYDKAQGFSYRLRSAAGSLGHIPDIPRAVVSAPLGGNVPRSVAVSLRIFSESVRRQGVFGCFRTFRIPEALFGAASDMGRMQSGVFRIPESIFQPGEFCNVFRFGFRKYTWSSSVPLYCSPGVPAALSLREADGQKDGGLRRRKAGQPMVA